MIHDPIKPANVRAALISVLKEVQQTSGLKCPLLEGSSIPPKVLPKFDSTVWPVATTWLAKRLNIIIDNDVHIFGGKDKAPLLTIDQSVALICEKHKKKPAQVAIAAE